MTLAATGLLLVVGLAAPASAAPAATGATDGAAAEQWFPDDVPEIGEVFHPGEVAINEICPEDWCLSSDADWDPTDSDGRWAWSYLWNAHDESEYYFVYFDPYGETLELDDQFTDGHEARADVVVSDPITERVLDRDTLFTSYRGKFNLGTPDGTGDIQEELTVSIRVCQHGTGICSPWENGLS